MSWEPWFQVIEVNPKQEEKKEIYLIEPPIPEAVVEPEKKGDSHDRDGSDLF